MSEPRIVTPQEAQEGRAAVSEQDVRAAQINARLAAADIKGVFTDGRLTWTDLITNAPADLAWLLAERADLLRRVEAAERAGRDRGYREGTAAAYRAAGLLPPDAIENGADL